MPSLPLFPTSLVGSYAQPEWLIDRARLADRFPPRVRARELWRPAPEHLPEAQDDATLRRVGGQGQAGLATRIGGGMRGDGKGPGRNSLNSKLPLRPPIAESQ
jgi:5-methyltetrahydropteroyltriglutamate--homocysteine methyltransferase